MNALEIQGLTKKYPSFLLDHISFSLPQGAIMGLIGENGAGKTTIMKSILQLVRHTEGTIRVLGRDPREGIASLKEEVGIVMDEGNFPDCFLAKDVDRVMGKTYKNWDSGKFWDMVKDFKLPENTKVKEMSRGNKMKLLLLAALSHNPRLLILDEATSGLDPMARDEILDLFNEFTRKDDHSILISSHIVTDLEKICDYITFIHEGQLLFSEEKDLMKEKYGILRCSLDTLESLPKASVKGMRKNDYGVEVLVERDKISEDFEMEYPGIEEIMLYMTRRAVR